MTIKKVISQIDILHKLITDHQLLVQQCAIGGLILNVLSFMLILRNNNVDFLDNQVETIIELIMMGIMIEENLQMNLLLEVL